MTKAPQPAARRTQAQDDPIDGEVVETTERALSVLSGSQAATLDSSMVAILTKAELDQMVVTARANPRSIQGALEATRELACLDLQTATECGYALPRGRDEQTGKQNVITGPSVRLAEIVACQWGNCQAASRVTDVNRTEGWVEAEGIFIDFQTNYRVTSRVRRSIRGKAYQGKPGKVFGDDMINVTSNAAAAIAFRNAVFKGVPKPIWSRAYEETRKIVRGDEKTLGARRVDLLVAFRDNLQISPDKVYAILGVKGEQDIGLDELVSAAGFYSALKNNEVTVEDLLKEIAPGTSQKTLQGAFESQGAKPPETPAHDPDTGEVREQAKPPPKAAPKAATQPTGAKATGAEVVLEGKAPAGVIHFLAGTDFLDDNGMRLTFKDGARWNTAKPTANLPVYTEVADEPAPAKEEKQPAGELSNGPASESSQPETDAGDASAETGGATPASPVGDDDEIDFDQAADAAEEQAHAEEQVVDAESQDDDEDQVEEPQEFTDFRERVSALDSWLTVKAALKALRATDAYKTAEKADKKAIRLAARDVVEALRETGKDPIDPAADPEFYGLWLDGAAPPEVDAVWSRLIRAKAYQALPEVTRDALADATEKARAV